MRSQAGCIIDPKDFDKVKASTIYKSNILPVQKYIVSEFPYKGKLSVLISILKVYPALGKFAAIHGLDEDGAVIEIYDIPGKKILYRKEIVEKLQGKTS